MRVGRKGLSQAQKQRVWEVRAEGLSDAAIARRLGVESRRVTRYLAACGGICPAARSTGGSLLTLAEREEISHGIARRDSDRQIGRDLGRCHTTIAREIERLRRPAPLPGARRR